MTDDDVWLELHEVGVFLNTQTLCHQNKSVVLDFMIAEAVEPSCDQKNAIDGVLTLDLYPDHGAKGGGFTADMVPATLDSNIQQILKTVNKF